MWCVASCYLAFSLDYLLSIRNPVYTYTVSWMTEILLNKLSYAAFPHSQFGLLNVCSRNWINFYVPGQDFKLKLMKRWQQLFVVLGWAKPGVYSQKWWKEWRDGEEEGCEDSGATREMKDRWIKCMWYSREKLSWWCDMTSVSLGPLRISLSLWLEHNFTSLLYILVIYLSREWEWEWRVGDLGGWWDRKFQKVGWK